MVSIFLREHLIGWGSSKTILIPLFMKFRLGRNVKEILIGPKFLFKFTSYEDGRLVFSIEGKGTAKIVCTMFICNWKIEDECLWEVSASLWESSMYIIGHHPQRIYTEFPIHLHSRLSRYFQASSRYCKTTIEELR